MTESTKKRRTGLQATIFGLMAFIAACALIIWGATAEYRRVAAERAAARAKWAGKEAELERAVRLAQLDVVRAIHRAGWSRRMAGKGYVSASQVTAEGVNYESTKIEFDRLNREYELVKGD